MVMSLCKFAICTVFSFGVLQLFLPLFALFALHILRHILRDLAYPPTLVHANLLLVPLGRFGGGVLGKDFKQNHPCLNAQTSNPAPQANKKPAKGQRVRALSWKTEALRPTPLHRQKLPRGTSKGVLQKIAAHCTIIVHLSGVSLLFSFLMLFFPMPPEMILTQMSFAFSLRFHTVFSVFSGGCNHFFWRLFYLLLRE